MKYSYYNEGDDYNMNDNYKEAILYFINNPEVSIKETAIKYKIDRGTLGKKLTELGLNDAKIRQKKYNFNENYFEEITTPEQAYWLGWLHSDGNIKQHQVRLRVSVKDVEILELFNQSLNSNIEIKIESGRGYDNSKEIANLTISSIKMVEDLKKYGIVENKTHIINFYNFNNIELTKAYIRGIFDGDGWCSFGENSREIGFSGNQQTCEKIAEFLEKELLIKNANVKPLKTISRLRICNKAGIVSFYENILKGNRELSLKRKFDQIENFAVSERASKNRKTTLR